MFNSFMTLIHEGFDKCVIVHNFLVLRSFAGSLLGSQIGSWRNTNTGDHSCRCHRWRSWSVEIYISCRTAGCQYCGGQGNCSHWNDLIVVVGQGNSQGNSDPHNIHCDQISRQIRFVVGRDALPPFLLVLTTLHFANFLTGCSGIAQSCCDCCNWCRFVDGECSLSSCFILTPMAHEVRGLQLKIWVYEDSEDSTGFCGFSKGIRGSM